MNWKEIFGMEAGNDDDDQININLMNVVLPMDIALQLLFRQQQQLFQALSALNSRLDVGDQVATYQGERMEHLHSDVVELQQVLEGASKHPVEKVDDMTEERVNKKDERPN